MHQKSVHEGLRKHKLDYCGKKYGQLTNNLKNKFSKKF